MPNCTRSVSMADLASEARCGRRPAYSAWIPERRAFAKNSAKTLRHVFPQQTNKTRGSVSLLVISKTIGWRGTSQDAYDKSHVVVNGVGDEELASVDTQKRQLVDTIKPAIN